MSKHVETITKHTCDICNKECEPITKIEIPMRYYQEFNGNVIFNVSYYLPYGTNNGDVCMDCFKEAITKLYDKYVRNN